MLLHYSISFSDCPITHHGEISYPISAYQNYDKYTDSMIAFVKADLTKSIKKWGFSPEDMIKADFYFYKRSEEVIFFSWEKEDVTKLHSTTIQ